MIRVLRRDYTVVEDCDYHLNKSMHNKEEQVLFCANYLSIFYKTLFAHTG